MDDSEGIVFLPADINDELSSMDEEMRNNIALVLNTKKEDKIPIADRLKTFDISKTMFNFINTFNEIGAGIVVKKIDEMKSENAYEDIDIRIATAFGNNIEGSDEEISKEAGISVGEYRKRIIDSEPLRKYIKDILNVYDDVSEIKRARIDLYCDKFLEDVILTDLQHVKNPLQKIKIISDFKKIQKDTREYKSKLNSIENNKYTFIQQNNSLVHNPGSDENTKRLDDILEL